MAESGFFFSALWTLAWYGKWFWMAESNKGLSLTCGFYALVNDCDCEPGKEGNKHVECSCLVYLSYSLFWETKFHSYFHFFIHILSNSFKYLLCTRLNFTCCGYMHTTMEKLTKVLTCMEFIITEDKMENKQINI